MRLCIEFFFLGKKKVSDGVCVWSGRYSREIGLIGDMEKLVENDLVELWRFA